MGRNEPRKAVLGRFDEVNVSVSLSLMQFHENFTITADGAGTPQSSMFDIDDLDLPSDNHAVHAVHQLKLASHALPNGCEG